MKNKGGGGRFDASRNGTARANVPITICDLLWAVGFLEGEGSFSFRGRDTRSSAAQVQLWPLEKLQRILGGRIYATGNKLGTWSTWDTTGPRAVGIMMTCYSFLSPRRRQQVEKALANWRGRPTHNAYKQFCKAGHRYDIFKKSKKPNGRIHNIRLCSVCQKQYWQDRKLKVANG